MSGPRNGVMVDRGPRWVALRAQKIGGCRRVFPVCDARLRGAPGHLYRKSDVRALRRAGAREPAGSDGSRTVLPGSFRPRLRSWWAPAEGQRAGRRPGRAVGRGSTATRGAAPPSCGIARRLRQRIVRLGPARRFSEDRTPRRGAWPPAAPVVGGCVAALRANPLSWAHPHLYSGTSVAAPFRTLTKIPSRWRWGSDHPAG